jgi:ATP-dependent Lon protease
VLWFIDIDVNGSLMKRKNGKSDVIVKGEQEIRIPKELPVVAAREIVAFPGVMLSLHVGRSPSVRAVEEAKELGGIVFIVAQKNQESDNPKADELFRTGVVAQVVRMLKLPDDRYKVLLQGLTRANATKFLEEDGYLKATVDLIQPKVIKKLPPELKTLSSNIRENLQLLVEREYLPEEMLVITEEISDPGALADIVVAHFRPEPHRAQEILEEFDVKKRLKIADQIVSDEVNRIALTDDIRDRAKNEMEKGQRDYYLREQIKQIQKELGDEDSSSEDLDLLKQALNKAKLTGSAKEEADRQLKRLERMHSEAGEYSLLRTYLEWLSELPWSLKTEDQLDIATAQKTLDRDHFGLDKAKDRILEYLSIRKLNPNSKGPILCFIGPPGVGKTSLGRSISKALGRKFARISLGGVRDEAEIRGHRRTYVGALPGKIIQALRQAGSKNGVIVLDELDKIGADFRGDPAASLLEVLDPQQNKEFVDHYLSVPFDLSETIFVATANTVDTIPEALLDRLEVIYISGYTTEEKMKISERFLIPRQLKENGVHGKKLHLQEKSLNLIIERYTQEAGVRGLEREIGNLIRKLARQYVESKKLPPQISPEIVKKLLGNTKFDPESNELQDAVGLARGLAWTVHGGELMPIEVSVAKGNGQLTLTGHLGTIMQESARAALFYARSHAEELGLDAKFNSKFDLHVHVPNGATPKDGPSAGITIATALISVLSNRVVKKDFAMTGEITLRGNVLAIGGLKEKALAALRYGIKKIIIPYDNLKDLSEIPEAQRKKLSFVPVKHIREILTLVLGAKQKERSKLHRSPTISADV